METAPALERARAAGVPALFRDHRGRAREAFDRELVTLLREHGVDLVCLAGFMRRLSPVLLRAFPGRVVNVHPSLLPAFPGLEAQRQAFEYGVKVSGATVHLVDEGLDSGPIVLQEAVPVLDGDTPETPLRAHPAGRASDLSSRGEAPARRSVPARGTTRGHGGGMNAGDAFDYLAKGCVDVVTPEALKPSSAAASP